MFSAMILACVLNQDGSADRQNCRGFVSPYIWIDLEQCMQALAVGIPTVEEQGWTIQDYECFNWEKKEGTSL